MKQVQDGNKMRVRGEAIMEKYKKRFISYCERHSYKPRSIITFVAVLLLVIIGIGIISNQNARYFSKPTSLGLKDIGELATQAGYFTTVQTINKSRDVLGWEVPGTQSNYIYSYDGTIKAGIDFQDINMEVDEVNHIIKITFPEFRILSTEIQDDKYS